ncbi:MAG: LysR family transcriptional regulator [Steroidobacteraceae bacterium]
MHFRKLDLNLLVALDALLSERNVSRAAERLYLSQSAASGALARLREYFHDELLTPMGRQLVLTPLAETLLPSVRAILRQIHETIESKPAFDPAQSERRFRIMASDYTTTVLLAEALRRIEALAPGLSFDMVPQSETPADSLERGEVELVVVPEAYVSQAHPAATLFEDSFVCVVWNENSEVGSELSWEQYLQLGHVVARFGRARMPAFDEWFLNRYGYARRIEVVTTQFNTLPHLVIGTRRVATVHRRLAQMYVKYLPLRIVTPPVEFPTIVESLQWHAGQERDPAMQWLRGRLLEAAGQI